MQDIYPVGLVPVITVQASSLNSVSGCLSAFVNGRTSGFFRHQLKNMFRKRRSIWVVLRFVGLPEEGVIQVAHKLDLVDILRARKIGRREDGLGRNGRITEAV